MPRLTTLDYLRQRAALRDEWFANNAYGFVVLSPTEQFVLHDYFEPTKDLSPVGLLAHRKEITARQPSLPQQAGRAFAHIRPFLQLAIEPVAKRPTKQRSRTWTASNRSVRVLSLVNPQLEAKAFANIIMELARQGPPPGMAPAVTSRAPSESEPPETAAQK